MSASQQSLLSEGVRAKIDHWLQRFPSDQKRSAVIEALKYAQEDNKGFLTTPLMDAVAENDADSSNRDPGSIGGWLGRCLVYAPDPWDGFGWDGQLLSP